MQTKLARHLRVNDWIYITNQNGRRMKDPFRVSAVDNESLPATTYLTFYDTVMKQTRSTFVKWDHAFEIAKDSLAGRVPE